MAEHYYGCEISLEGGVYVVRKDGERKGSFSDKTAARRWARELTAAAERKAADGR